MPKPLSRSQILRQHKCDRRQNRRTRYWYYIWIFACSTRQDVT